MEKIIEDLRIRPLTPADRELVYNFFRELGDEGSTFFNCGGINERRTYMFLNGERPNHIYLAAVADTHEGEEIAGIVFLFKTDTKIPWLGIGITEKWKGRHLGRRLMTEAREWAQANGAGGIILTTDKQNLRGQKLYERMGFKRIGTYVNGEYLYLLSFPNDKQD